MTGKSLKVVLVFAFYLFTGTNLFATGINSNIAGENEFLYKELQEENTKLPSAEVFALALKGYSNLKAIPGNIKKDIITVVDFSLPSTEKRLWVIDLVSKKVLFNDWVAHGRNSGNNYAKKFSNTPSSNASSIGFYVTGRTYTGKHGLSLYLDGKDKGFNDNARARSIVMHGADYVGGDFIKKYGRLGRSLGCPSVSMDIFEDVIDTIRDGSILFIYSPNENFMTKSTVLNQVAQSNTLAAVKK